MINFGVRIVKNYDGKIKYLNTKHVFTEVSFRCFLPN